MVVHVFNPSTLGGRGRQISVSLRPAWSTELVLATQRNPGLKNKTRKLLNKQTNKTQKDQNKIKQKEAMWLECGCLHQ